MAQSGQGARGCLTAAGLQALREAVPGKAPVELARHLAGCTRCQSHLLASGRGPAQNDGKNLRVLRAVGYVLLGGSLLAGAGLAIVTLLRR